MNFLMEEETDGLWSLPHDVLCRILEGLDGAAVAKLAKLSKGLRLFCMEEALWTWLALKCAGKKFTWRGSWMKSAIYASRGEDAEVGFMNISVAEGFRSDYLYRRWYRSQMDVSLYFPERNMNRTLCRIDGANIDPTQFVDAFENTCVPVVITNIPEFRRVMRWDVAALEASFGDVLFCVEHPRKGSFDMELSNYLDYARNQWDEDPLYLFDSAFASKAAAIEHDYALPSIFSNDLLPAMEPQAERPMYRWLLMGPPRSGSSWHIDPWASSAWNLLITGKKRWAMYPPGKIPPGVRLSVDPFSKDQDFEVECHRALQWFLEVLPQLKEDEKPIEVLQEPGETMFIPHGWWHCVLNLEMTVSVTQNFVSQANLTDAIHLLAQGASRYFAQKFPARNKNPAGENPLPTLSVEWVGSLMRSVWQERPDLQGELQQCAEAFVYGRELERCLSEICKKHRLPQPQKQDIFPFRATSNLLFNIGGHAIKLFVHPNPLNLCIQALAESTALEAIAQIQPSVGVGHGSFGGCGIVDITMGERNVVIETPYLISTHCEGIQLSHVFVKLNHEQRKQLAQGLGRIAAAFHIQFAIPSSSESKKNDAEIHHCSISDVDAGGCGSVTKNGSVMFCSLRSAFSWIGSNVVSAGAFFQAQHPDRVWSTNLNGMLSYKQPQTQTQRQDCGSAPFIFSVQDNDLESYKDWSPFLAFLQWRHAVVLHRPSETNLPEHLLPQLEAYLPSRTEFLLPLIDEASLTARQQPVGLHGDLTNDNILLTVDDSGNPCVIDFGDFSYGDPLYDFVSLSLSSLRGDGALIEAFGISYRREWKTKADADVWRGWKQTRRFPVSYCIMCYCLLHEDDTFEWLFHEHPEYRQLRSLNEIERVVWGSLNHVFDSSVNM